MDPPPCGADNEACCAGNACDAGLTCVGGTCGCGTLEAGQVLLPGESVLSCGGSCGQFVLVMQGDGNLVLYQNGAPLWSSLWESGMMQPGSYAVMQGDGNLVVYGPGCGGPNGSCWNSGTAGYPGAGLSVQGDGNLVIYGPGCPGVNGSCWASSTFTQSTITITSALTDVSNVCFFNNTFVPYTQDAVSYLTVDGQTFYLPDTSAYVSVTETMGSTVSATAQCCYLDPCNGNASCWTPSGYQSCICLAPTNVSYLLDQCTESAQICQ